MNYSYFSYTRVIAAVVLFAGIILLWPGKLFFLNDDFVHLYLTSRGQWLQQNSFRPVCDLSMWIDYSIWGLNSTGFHLTNALLHLACTYLVYRFSYKLLFRYHQSAVASSNAILIASMFFVYAFHSETIYWVIGRSASLGALFFLLSMVHYMERNNGKHHLVYSILFFATGLFAYESVWITPMVFAVLSLMDVRGGRTNWKQERNHLVIAVAVLLAYFVLRYIAIQQWVADYEGRLFLNMDVAGIAKNFLKLGLRSFSKQTGEFLLIGTAFLVGITALVSFLITRRNILTVGLLSLWLLSFIPYLSLGIDSFGSEGERYLYLPSIFLCIILGLGIVYAARVYKYVISLVFFFVHILLLYDARRNYETASAVTLATVTELKNAGSSKQVYFMCLPEENKGALIFRDGIRQAILLFADSATRGKVLKICEGNYDAFHGTSEEDPLGLKQQPNVQVLFDYSKHSLIVSYLPPGTISE